MIEAGLETTTCALTTIVFQMINSNPTLAKPREGFEVAIPDPTALLDSRFLGKLPYLSACTQKGVPLAYGVSS